MERLTELKADLEARYGVKVTIGSLDVSNVASAEAFYNDLPSELRDNVDVLVNNAGISIVPRPIHESDFSDVNRVIDTNVKGVVLLTKLFVPGMLKRNTGHIINVSSTAGKESYPLLGIYAGTKWMVEAITTSLRAELVATPLRVSTVSPGMTVSEILDSVMGDASSAFYSGFKALDSADIAEDIVFVASRPAHVQVADIHTLPTAQATGGLVHRENQGNQASSSLIETFAAIGKK